MNEMDEENYEPDDETLEQIVAYGKKEEAGEFLELLFEDYLEKYGGFIQVMNNYRQLYFKSIPELLNNWSGFLGNVYFGVAPRNFERGIKETITYITCIWTDIDVRREDRDGSFDTQEEALKFISEFKIKPSVVVDSGYGLHLYWLLKKPCSDIDRPEEILKGVSKALRGDKGTWNINRLLRLPGTLNFWNPDNIRECKIISMENIRYDLQAFEEYRAIGVKEFENTAVMFNKDAPPVSLDGLNIENISPFIMTILRTGDTKGRFLKVKEGSRGLNEIRVNRSDRDQAVIYELLKTGHRPDTIRGLFINRDSPISDKYYALGRHGDYYLAQSIENAQKFIRSEVSQGKQDKNLIVQKGADLLLLIANTPDFPVIMREENGQQLFSFLYESTLTNTRVRVDTNKEILKEYRLTEDDLKYRDVTWEITIANYLMDIQARTGTDKIDGSMKEVFEFIKRINPRPRQEDYKKAEVNLKSLGVRQYTVTRDNISTTFMFGRFTFNEANKTFSLKLDKDLFPKIFGEVEGGKKETLYVKKYLPEYNPKQPKYDYLIKQYFARIRNIPYSIKQIRGMLLLENAGYLADVAQGRKTFRTKDARAVIDKWVRIGQEYGFTVSCHKKDEGLSIKKQMFFIRITGKRKDLIKRDNTFLEVLTKFIYEQPGNNNDLQISKYRAQGLFNQYGVEAVKKALADTLKAAGGTIADLERILNREPGE